MQAFTGIGISTAAVSAIDKIERYALEAGRHVYNAFQRVLPYFMDPRKGVPISISAIKLLSLSYVDVNSLGKIDEFASYLERIDLPTLLCGSSGCIQPPQPFYIDWSVINSAIPDLQCGFGDVVCAVQNGFRAIARAIAGAFYGLGSTLFWLAYNVANIVVIAVSRITAFFIRYVVGNIAKFVLTVWNGIVDSLKRMFCMYITLVSPAISVYKGVKSMISGKKAFGIMWLLSPLVPISLVAQDCGLMTSPQPVQPSPTVPPDYQYPLWTRPSGESVAVLDGAVAILASRTVNITDLIDVKDYNIGM